MAGPRTAVIVQARAGSSRLPGKVLMDLGGRSALARCLTRCAAIAGADVVICAAPIGAADDRVADEARRTGAMVVRGPEGDVLGRYAKAAREVEADRVMRVTSDCPLIDPVLCDRLIGFFEMTGADYACNNMPPSWPHGLDCDVFDADLLYRADREATEPFDREHVTPWIRRHPDVVRACLAGPGGVAADQRWTLDYPQDYAFLSAVFQALGPAADTAGAAEVMALLARRPDLGAINRELVDPRRIGAGQRAEILSIPQALKAA